MYTAGQTNHENKDQFSVSLYRNFSFINFWRENDRYSVFYFDNRSVPLYVKPDEVKLSNCQKKSCKVSGIFGREKFSSLLANIQYQYIPNYHSIYHQATFFDFTRPSDKIKSISISRITSRIH